MPISGFILLALCALVIIVSGSAWKRKQAERALRDGNDDLPGHSAGR